MCDERDCGLATRDSLVKAQKRSGVARASHYVSCPHLSAGMHGMQRIATKPQVVLMSEPVPGLAEAIRRNSWERVRAATAQEALARLPRSARPLVVVVQPGEPAAEAADLIRRLRGTWWESLAVVLLGEHEQEAELLSSGPVCGLAGSAKAEAIEAAVGACLERIRETRPSRPAVA
jgi:hypothetical protein